MTEDYGFFDAHCHLQDAAFDADRETMIEESRAAGVSHFIVPATDIGNFDATLALAASDDRIYCGLGIHPHSAKEWNSDVRDRIRAAASENEKIVMVGEIGLDYHYDFAPRDVQRRAFSEQIELAIELKKPIAIHTRESEEEVFAIVEEHYRSLSTDLPRGQFHCFSASIDWMHRAVELGFYVSFTGNITFKKSTLDEVVREAPLDRILLETDSPYLAPAPHRGKRNSPALLPFTALKVAELKHLDLPSVMHRTFENTLSLFQLSSIRRSGVSLLVSLLFVLSATTLASVVGPTVLTSIAFAQEPGGAAPPDSILTGDRRKAEELRKKQEAALAKEAEQHRQDSIKAAQEALLDAQARAREQARQDSLRVINAELTAERHAAFLLTPKPWKAVGLGFSLGVGNMTMAPPVYVPTSVFAYGIDASTQLTRRLDFDLSYNHMNIGGGFSSDSLWRNGTGPVSTNYLENAPFHQSGADIDYITNEIFTADWISADFRYIITRPDALISFYFGLGYDYIIMTNTQHYYPVIDSATHGGDQTYQKSFERNALKVLFGARHDFELGQGLTLQSYIQIATIAGFQGQVQPSGFLLGPTSDLLIMTHFNLGFTLYYGWWGVPRQQ